MTHDPLCLYKEFIPCCKSYLEHEYPQPAKQHYVPCQCDLIDRVRQDVASKIIQYGKDTHPSHNGATVCQRCDIVAAYNYAAEIAKGK